MMGRQISFRLSERRMYGQRHVYGKRNAMCERRYGCRPVGAVGGGYGSEPASAFLSCLVHARPIKRKIASDVYEDMLPEEINEGLNKIKEFIPDFNYEELLENTYTIDHIKELYNSELNAYLKIQLFRALKDIVDDKQLRLRPMDSAWYKFIDETYHIENDYLHYLDVMKFNIVPDYIMKKVDGIMSEL